MIDVIQCYVAMAIRSYIGAVDYEIEEQILDVFKYLKFAYQQDEIVQYYYDDVIICID